MGATKAKIVELVLTTPLPEAVHGSTQLSEALVKEAQAVSEGPNMQHSRLRQWWAMGAFAVKMMRYKAIRAATSSTRRRRREEPRWKRGSKSGLKSGGARAEL